MKTIELFTPVLKRALRVGIVTLIASGLAAMQNDPKWLIWIPVISAIGKALRQYTNIPIPF